VSFRLETWLKACGPNGPTTLQPPVSWLGVVGPVVGAVALVMVAVVVVVFAVVMMFAVVLTVVVARRVVGAVPGDGGTGTPDGDGERDGERCGYARYEFHSCLLMDEFRS
jgi:hypothetical protein